jgi:hypothetical protein
MAVAMVMATATALAELVLALVSVQVLSAVGAVVPWWEALRRVSSC